MSEFQYYEFLAIDRPLTPGEKAELRQLSTRARITASSFITVHHWGNFKGSPSRLMERYFDAHVYWAYWGTAVFMLRLPLEALVKETTDALTEDDCLWFKATPTHWIVTWHREESRRSGEVGWHSGRGWMARLAPLRDELLRGDLRGLYIGWLAALGQDLLEDDNLEPFSLAGLGDWTPAQRALAKFLEVDGALLAGAAMGVAAPETSAERQLAMQDWLSGLTREESMEFLQQLLDGRGARAERELKVRFAAWRAGRTGAAAAPRRTVGELRRNAAKARRIRRANRLLEQQRLEQEQRRQHEANLKLLAKNFPAAWQSVEKTLERRSGAAYDRACGVMVELAEAYAMHKDRESFALDLKAFMAGHMGRKALIERLVKAGLWQNPGIVNPDVALLAEIPAISHEQPGHGQGGQDDPHRAVPVPDPAAVEAHKREERQGDVEQGRQGPERGRQLDER